jgi:hypothetical protein
MNIYPNPASQETVINYFLTSQTDVKIMIYNSYGQLMDNLSKNNKQLPGNYELKYNVSNLAQGLYYCKIEVNGKSITKKFSVTK